MPPPLIYFAKIEIFTLVIDIILSCWTIKLKEDSGKRSNELAQKRKELLKCTETLISNIPKVY